MDNLVDEIRPNFTSYFRFDTFWNARYGENTSLDTVGSSIERNCLDIFLTLRYGVVLYGTIPFKQRTINENICPKRESNLSCHRLAL